MHGDEEAARMPEIDEKRRGVIGWNFRPAWLAKLVGV